MNIGPVPIYPPGSAHLPAPQIIRGFLRAGSMPLRRLPLRNTYNSDECLRLIQAHESDIDRVVYSTLYYEGYFPENTSLSAAKYEHDPKKTRWVIASLSGGDGENDDSYLTVLIIAPWDGRTAQSCERILVKIKRWINYLTRNTGFTVLVEMRSTQVVGPNYISEVCNRPDLDRDWEEIKAAVICILENHKSTRWAWNAVNLLQFGQSTDVNENHATLHIAMSYESMEAHWRPAVVEIARYLSGRDLKLHMIQPRSQRLAKFEMLPPGTVPEMDNPLVTLAPYQGTVSMGADLSASCYIVAVLRSSSLLHLKLGLKSLKELFKLSSLILSVEINEIPEINRTFNNKELLTVHGAPKPDKLRALCQVRIHRDLFKGHLTAAELKDRRKAKDPWVSAHRKVKVPMVSVRRKVEVLMVSVHHKVSVHRKVHVRRRAEAPRSKAPRTSVYLKAKARPRVNRSSLLLKIREQKDGPWDLFGLTNYHVMRCIIPGFEVTAGGNYLIPAEGSALRHTDIHGFKPGDRFASTATLESPSRNKHNKTVAYLKRTIEKAPGEQTRAQRQQILQEHCNFFDSDKQTFGQLYAVSGFAFRTPENGMLDWALFKVLPSRVSNNNLPRGDIWPVTLGDCMPPERIWDQPLRRPIPPNETSTISEAYKLSAITKATTGKFYMHKSGIRCTDWGYLIEEKICSKTDEYAFISKNVNAGPVFATHGDSGAMVYDGRARAVGQLFRGQSSESTEALAYVTPMEYILAHIAEFLGLPRNAVRIAEFEQGEPDNRFFGS